MRWILLVLPGALWLKACVPMERLELAPPAFDRGGVAGDRAVREAGPSPDAAAPEAQDRGAAADEGPEDPPPRDQAGGDGPPLDQGSGDGAPADGSPADRGAVALDRGLDQAPADRAVDQAPADLAVDPAPDRGVADQGGPDQAPPCVVAAERCNGLDDDCDGRVDEDPEGAPAGDADGRCRVEAGECALEATWRCHAGRWVCRPDPQAPLQERVGAVSGCDCDAAGLLLPQLAGMRCRRRLPWPLAAAACAATWMRLVVIEDRQHANQLQQLGLLWREIAWVGLAEDPQGVLRWIDGRLAEQGFTLGLELDDPDPDPDGACVAFDLGRGRLRAEPCLQGRAFLCEDIPSD